MTYAAPALRYGAYCIHQQPILPCAVNSSGGCTSNTIVLEVVIFLELLHLQYGGICPSVSILDIKLLHFSTVTWNCLGSQICSEGLIDTTSV